jgi:hypothetical protein
VPAAIIPVPVQFGDQGSPDFCIRFHTQSTICE